MALLVASVALALSVVGGTLAYIVATTGDVKNTFEPGRVVVQINEENGAGGQFVNKTSTEKSNVTVTNTGNVSAYVRAMLVINMVDAYGNYYGGTPVAGTHYEIDEGSWIMAGGYYYYPEALPAGATTKYNLVDSITAIPSAIPEGYTLRVDVIVDAIQAEGLDNGRPVIESVWGVAMTAGAVAATA